MADRKSKSIDMLNGPLAGKLVKFAIPIALASILQQLFNTADSAVAGQFIGPEALAAIGGAMPVALLLISLFTGLSIGTNVLVAMRIGNRQPEKIETAVHTSIFVALASGLLLLVLGIAFVEPILKLIAMPEAAFDLAVAYLDIYFVGMPFSMLYNFGSAILRSKGDTTTPLYALVAGVTLNIVLNIVCVTLLPWGVVGIAVATGVSNAVGAAIVLAFLMREKDPYHLSWRCVRPTKADLSIILKVGVPAGIQGVVFALSNVVIQSAVNSFGSASTAGVAAALNYEFYTYFFINAFAQAAVTFVGQNYAARRLERCDKVLKLCLVFAAACVVVLNAAWLALGPVALGVFTADDEAIRYGLMRMWGGMAFQFTAVAFEVSAGTMRGMGWSLTPALITVVGSCFLRIGWVFTVFNWMPEFPVLVAVYPISWTVTSVAMLVALYFVRKRAFAKARPSA